MKKLLALLAVPFVFAACATPGPEAEAGYQEKYTRTGTNISERDRMGISSVSPEEFEKQRAANSGTLVVDPAKKGGR
jgi:hypothetical protein